MPRRQWCPHADTGRSRDGRARPRSQTSGCGPSAVDARACRLLPSPCRGYSGACSPSGPNGHRPGWIRGAEPEPSGGHPAHRWGVGGWRDSPGPGGWRPGRPIHRRLGRRTERHGHGDDQGRLSHRVPERRDSAQRFQPQLVGFWGHDPQRGDRQARDRRQDQPLPVRPGNGAGRRRRVRILRRRDDHGPGGLHASDAVPDAGYANNRRDADRRINT
jgi:hypothetical protein